VTPNPGFKVTVYLQVKYLKNRHYGQSCYRTLTGNHTLSIEWYHFQLHWLTRDWDIQVAVFFDIEYLRIDTRKGP